MSTAKPGDTVGWPPDDPVERWVVVDVDGDGIAVVRHESDLDERNLAAASIDSLIVVGQQE
ncbi:MAG TPA: hypothetical protein VHO00_04580 [Actinomycetes bacterium]|jgi:hypothetical protein|nr:hypothetical protein [Actinomycetes bacterium]